MAKATRAKPGNITVTYGDVDITQHIELCAEELDRLVLAIDFDDAYPSYAEALDSPPLTDEQKRSAFQKAMGKNG